jgi:hypothetical protein
VSTGDGETANFLPFLIPGKFGKFGKFDPRITRSIAGIIVTDR